MTLSSIVSAGSFTVGDETIQLRPTALTLTVTEVSSVPEPTTWAMLLLVLPVLDLLPVDASASRPFASLKSTFLKSETQSPAQCRGFFDMMRHVSATASLRSRRALALGLSGDSLGIPAAKFASGGGLADVFDPPRLRFKKA